MTKEQKITPENLALLGFATAPTIIGIFFSRTNNLDRRLSFDVHTRQWAYGRSTSLRLYQALPAPQTIDQVLGLCGWLQIPTGDNDDVGTVTGTST